MQIKRLPVSEIELNTGQIDGLPANPRQWTRDDIDRIANSLRETPELFEMRPCIVFPHEGKYILLAGNLRFTGARQNGDKDVPCCVVKADTPVEKLKEIVIKDNGSFGNWDFDSLANEWDDLPLTDWGVPAWNTDDADITDLDTSDPEPAGGDNYVIKYEIIFDSERQQGRWYEFLAYLKNTFPECDTIAEKLDKYLTEIWAKK